MVNAPRAWTAGTVSAVHIILPVPDTDSTGPRVVSSETTVLSVSGTGTGTAGDMDATFFC
jgi:hypothetical protein